MIFKKYKDVDIKLTYDGKFQADGIDESYETYQLIINAIDKASKVKYKQIEAYLLSGSKITKVKITRPAQGNSWNGSSRFWIKYDNGKREIANTLLVSNIENDILINQLEFKYEELKKISSEIRELEKNLLTKEIVLEKI